VTAASTPPRVVPIDSAYDDPDALLDLVRASGPYWNQARYIPLGAVLAPGHPLVVPGAPPAFNATPVFRADWFRGGESTPAGERIARHEPFLEAARAVHGGTRAVPLIVHVNLNAPGPTTDAGHLDVPLFRGLDNRSAPGWLLLGLARAGLASRWRLQVATAISWLYRGEGGGLTYWPSGPDAGPTTIGDVWNRAVVLDTDSVHHRVDSVGAPSAVAALVGRQSSIAVAGDEPRWVIDGSQRPASYALDEVRISISWKAAVFGSDDDHHAYLAGDDPLTIEQAAQILGDEVRRRGGELPADTTHDDVRFANAVETTIPRVTPPTIEEQS
jgi:hypothetical protein